MTTILKSKSLISTFALLLCSATASVVSASSLVELSAYQISQDATLSYDSATGESTIVMAGFEPFEHFSDLAGIAALKSVGTQVTPTVTLNGGLVSGGALLDLTLVYTTESNDPFDVRGYDRGIFLSRDLADIIRYDNKIVECSENVTELVYDDAYRAGVSYGLLAGVYRAFPRYRGHYRSGFRSPYGYSYGSIPDRRHSMRGYSSYRNHSVRGGYGKYSSGRHSGHRSSYGRNRHNYDRSISIDRHRTNGDRHRTNDVRGTRGRNGTHQNSAAPIQPPEGLAGLRSDTKRFENHPDSNSVLTGPLITKGHDRRRASPTTSSDRPVRIKTPRTRTKRVRPVSPNKDRNRSTRSRSKSDGAAQNSRRGQSLDRLFRDHNPRSSNAKRFENFYPMQAGLGTYSHPVSVAYRCVREEYLTFHIPEDRLQAARFDGMTVMIATRNGQETPLYIPPNYIQGYQKARRLIGKRSLTPYNTPLPSVGYPQITK